MSKPIIKVENLSKRYRLGLKEKQSKTLVGQLTNIIKSPYDNYQRLRNLSKFYKEDDSIFWALKDINFEVQQGEVLGIIGKNGAGKSTLLKILSQITEPTSGRIEIHGRVASLLEIGTGFHPELSGRENIYMNGTILGMTRKEIDAKLDEIIDFSGVEKFIDTPVKFYSSGMKVRLGFSVAAHLDPEILIIDEVLAVGDYEFQQKCLGKMEDVSKNQGRTVLFVSHNLEAVNSLCNRTIFLNDGEIIRIDTSELVLMDYISKQTTESQHFFDKSESINEFSNDKIELLEAHFKNNERILSRLNINEDSYIFIKFKVKKCGVKLNLSISIYGPNNEYVFASPSITDDFFYQSEFDCGEYIGLCHLPKFLFNNHIYKVSVFFVENGKEIILSCDHLLSIEFFDDGKFRKDFFGKWNGVVRPILKWEVKKDENFEKK